MTKEVDQEMLDRVYASYGRCSLSKEFYKDFYDTLLGKSPDIAEKFRFTDMAAQQEAVKHGLGFLILYAKGHHTAIRKLKELGISHSRKFHDIEPKHYRWWKESLLHCVGRHDYKSSPQLLQEWEAIISQGIEGIMSQY